MRRIDLGGTACYEDDSGDSVSISIDGSNSDDMLTPVVVGDYTSSPFPNNTFDEAFGCCVLEADPPQLRALAQELLRIMKPGGHIIIKGCGIPLPSDTTIFQDAGFILVDEAGVYQSSDDGELGYDNPFMWEVPKGD